MQTEPQNDKSNVTEATPATPKRKRRIGYRIVVFLVGWFFRLFFRIHCEGKENLPREGGAIVCMNHFSNLDPVMVAAVLPRSICYLAKAELFKIPVLSSVLKCLGVTPLDRSGGDIVALKKAIELAKSEELVGIFPQGTRFRGQNPVNTTVHGGAGMIAYRASCPMIPISIRTKKMKYRFFRRVDIKVGAPMSAEELGLTRARSAVYQEATDRVFARICEMGEFEKAFPLD